ncbi:MAG: hypothetical protein ACYT04_78795, partial [Nostoc sp.]
SERWSLSHGKPLVAVGKLAIGGVVGWNSTQKIVAEVRATESQIQDTYAQIKAAQNTNAFAIPQGLLIAAAGVIFIGMAIMSLRKKVNV